jgi:hypothetical protein
MTEGAVFLAGGALPPDYPYYCLRQADETAVWALSRCKPVYTIAPRQMGKSSLLNRLAARLQVQGWCCCCVDLGTLRNLSTPLWFRHLSALISESCPSGGRGFIPADQQEFRNFLVSEIG